MLNNSMNPREGYEYLIQAAQQVVNSGADPAKVEAFVGELAPIYQRVPLKLEKQPLLTTVGAAAEVTAVSAERPRIELPTAAEFEWWQDALIGTAVMAIPPVGITVTASRGIAAFAGVTIGLGPQVTIGAGKGGSLGCGLCVTLNGKLGFYGSVGGLAGAMASISGTIQLTIIGGGVDKFSGWAWGAGIAGGEEIVGNAAALLSMTSPVQFLGITAGIGLGVGIPLEVFITAQHTWESN